MSLTLLASAARTATVSSPQVERRRYRGVHVVVTCTAATASPSVVFTVEGYNTVTDAWYTLLTSAAVSSTSTIRLTVYPGCIASANTVANDALPEVWRVTATHADADSITYSVAANPLT